MLGVGAAAQCAFAMTSWGLPVLAPTLRSDFDLSLTEVGIAIASVNVGLVVAMLGWGLAADRFGERAVMASGLAASGLALAAAARVHDFALLVALLFVAGAGGASVNAASGRAILGWFPRESRGLALGIRQMAQPLGGALGALLLPIVVSEYGVGRAIAVLAASCLGAAAAVALWLRDPESVPVPVQEAKHPLRDTRIWRLAVGSGLLAVVQTTILAFAVLYLHGERGFSTRAAGTILAVMEASAVVVRIVSGMWSDRTGTRMRPLRQMSVLLAGLLGAVVLLLGAPDAVLVPVLVCCGTIALGWNTLSYAATAEFAGRDRSGAALGLQQSILAGAVGVTPVLFGALVDVSSWRFAYALAALLPLVAVFLFGSLSDRTCAEPQLE